MCTALLAEEEEADAEAWLESEMHISSNPLNFLYDQVAKEGSFGREQKKDHQLKHCWGQVLQIDRENINPNQVLLAACFMVSNGLLFEQCDCHSPAISSLCPPQRLTWSHCHASGPHPPTR